MKFNDKDIRGFEPFDDGVLLKVDQQKVLDAVDAENKVAIYLYRDEVKALMDSVYRDSPDEPAPEIPAAFHEFVTNSGDLNQALVVLNADAVRDCPLAKRNQSFVFISLDVLHRIKTKLDATIEHRKQTDAFDLAFGLMAKQGTQGENFH